MDHLQVPRGSIHGHIEIPLYCCESYETGPFLEYLDRLGWTRDEITNTFTTNRTLDEIHATLQKWCYFGIMNEFFGSINLDNFTEPSPNSGRRISTAALPGIVSSWRNEQAKITTAQRLETGRHLLRCISSISNLFREMQSTPPHFQTLLDGKLLLSIAVLVEYLMEVGLYGLWNLLEGNEYVSATENFMPGCTALLLSRMKEDGWCPNEIRMLGFNTPSSLLYFVSNLDPPRPEKDHAISKCNIRRCKAYNIDEATYKTKHMVDGCNCPFLFADQGDLFDILKSGSIPLASPFECAIKDPKQDQRVYVKLIDLKSHVKFVAISHVWSNGLGNQHDNGIPRCQFDRISRLVSNLYGGVPMPFWLDTLSFPLGPTEAYDLALRRMRDAYEEADKVLVLDSYLLSQEVKGMSQNEIATRLMMTPWSRRLWTLQEAVLGKCVTLQFNDTYTELDSLLESQSLGKHQNQIQNVPILSDNPTFDVAWDFLESLRYPYKVGDNTNNIVQEGSLLTNKVSNLTTAMKALAFRNTSVLTDEVLCLCVLLDLDLSVILQTPTADRMMKIWALQQNLFPSMIFWDGPKLEHPGFGWAAATLLRGGIFNPTVYQVERRRAKLLSTGLLVQYPGVVLSGLINPVPAFYFTDQVGGTYQVICLRSKKREHRSEQDYLTPSRVDDPTCFERLAIIMSRSLGDTTKGERNTNSQAILASVVKSENGIIYVRSLYSVSVVAIGSLEEHLQREKETNKAWLQYWKTAIIVNDNLGENLGVEIQGDEDKKVTAETPLTDDLDEPSEWLLRGRSTDIDQMWCVD